MMDNLFDQFPHEESEDFSQEILTVSELTSGIKGILESSFSRVKVEGEISNFKHYPSGHMYFTLKDEGAELSAVMFKGNNRFLRFAPKDGMSVVITGNISVYEQHGRYQIVARDMEESGLGNLFLKFEKLKTKLSEEGLFDEDIKKTLPKFPFRVGVVTSGKGAVIEDITHVLTRRAPHVEILLRPTLVQGKEAPADIVSAIQEFDKKGEVDVLIVGRGGGSIEDLWSFNEEIVARAIVDCILPVISAVGHETDFTIADFVADLRAPTPSAAAELVSPSLPDLMNVLNESENRIQEKLNLMMETAWQRLDGLTSRYGFLHPQILVEQKTERLKEIRDRLNHQIQFNLSMHQSKFDGVNQRLLSASPEGLLERGYSIVLKLPERKILNRVKGMKSGNKLEIIMSDGDVKTEVKKVNPASK